LLLAAVVLALSAALYLQGRRCEVCGPPLSTPDAPEGRFTVSEMSEHVLRPMPVEEPMQPRWRDVADVAYARDFREEFSYDACEVRVEYEACARTLKGWLRARGLKPWFVYQIKLVGAAPVLGPDETDNVDMESWSSWQLGRMGRWWCHDCDWNVSDAELGEHLSKGHEVRGYLLFDWLITDGQGECDHQFWMDRSLHVLWKVGQRDRGEHDSAPRWYGIERGEYGYESGDVGGGGEEAVFGEWEPARATVGKLGVPAGEYRVRMNLTEETWHSNLGDRTQELGGHWAWVLDGDLQFTVSDEAACEVSQASCPGCLPGPNGGTATAANGNGQRARGNSDGWAG